MLHLCDEMATERTVQTTKTNPQTGGSALCSHVLLRKTTGHYRSQSNWAPHGGKRSAQRFLFWRKIFSRQRHSHASGRFRESLTSLLLQPSSWSQTSSSYATRPGRHLQLFRKSLLPHGPTVCKHHGEQYCAATVVICILTPFLNLQLQLQHHWLWLVLRWSHLDLCANPSWHWICGLFLVRRGGGRLGDSGVKRRLSSCEVETWFWSRLFTFLVPWIELLLVSLLTLNW